MKQLRCLTALLAITVVSLTAATTTAGTKPYGMSPLNTPEVVLGEGPGLEHDESFTPPKTTPPRFLLSVTPSPQQLMVQFNRAKANGWVKLFTAVETKNDLLPGLLLAIASRETNLNNVIGDGGHGRGVFQIDDRHHQVFLRKYGALKTGRIPSVYWAAQYAGRILASHYDRTGPLGIPQWRRWKFAMAAYNAGFTGALRGYKMNPPNVDANTAHGNYATDVRKRRVQFLRILDLPVIQAVRRPPIESDLRSLGTGHGYMKPVRIVLHSTESYDAAGVSEGFNIASYWKRQGLGLGAHIIVDSDGNTSRVLDDTVLGYHVKSRNTGSLGIEQVGFARFTRAQWMTRKPQLNKVAKWIAWWSTVYKIPITRSPYAGVSSHLDQSRLIGGGHWDPGYGYPWDYVLKQAVFFKKNGWK